MIGWQFEEISALQYRNKALAHRVKGFESGAIYQQMKEDYHRMFFSEEKRIKKLKMELAAAHKQVVDNRKMWMQAFDDQEKEYKKELRKKQSLIRDLEKRNLELIRQRDAAKDKETEIRRENYALKTENEELMEKNAALHAQIHRDYENSSKPSSMSPNHKVIKNSREKTDRSPGGQKGHKPQPRKKQTPTETKRLEPERAILEDPDYKKTGRTIHKQVVDLIFSIQTIDYVADEYRNSKTGERYHAPFPNGVKDEMTYGSGVKAFLLFLNQYCCVSIDKTQELVSEMTHGQITPSKGFINGLAKEFSKKNEQERKRVFADLLLSPVLHLDFTNTRVNGKQTQVMVCATPGGDLVQYYAKESKGHKGVQGTPVETYQHTIVHDHDKTFYSYGEHHQECLAHVLRYLKDSIENEPDRTWNRSMHQLLREMIHYSNNRSGDVKEDAVAVNGFENRYRSIMQTAKDEYEDEPYSKYYKDGFNLFTRLNEGMEYYTLFLHDKNVPPTNNEAERDLRKVKRKQAQAVSFRSPDSVAYFCDFLGQVVMMKQKDPTTVFDQVAKIFE